MSIPENSHENSIQDRDTATQEMLDWNRPKPDTLPRPTFWPVVVAFGIVLIPFGFTTSLIISGVGLLILGMGLAGWIGELLHESKSG